MAPEGLGFPETRKGDTVEVLHGVPVADPYRWLEEVDSEETRDWITAQNELTFDVLGGIPAREAIRARLTELWNYERTSVPIKRGGRLFFTRNDGLQNQSVLYWIDALDGEPTILLDPNLLSEDGTVALTGFAASPDGRLVAYGLSSAGSDWQEWRVREVDTGRDREDLVAWVKFSEAAWAKDGGGFFYSRYDEPEEGKEYEGANYYHKLYYHRLGTPQSSDRLVYERPDQKEWGFGGEVTDDGRYLVVSVWKGTHRENGVFYQDLAAVQGQMVELLVDFDARYLFVGNDGPRFYFLTDLEAPMSRLVAIDIEVAATSIGDKGCRDEATRSSAEGDCFAPKAGARNDAGQDVKGKSNSRAIDIQAPDRAGWEEVIPEADDALQSVSLVGDRFFASYLHHAHSRVVVFDKAGSQAGEVDLPGIGTVEGFRGRQQDRETFYQFTGFTTPGTLYRYDLDTNRSEIFRQPQAGFDPSEYVTEQVFYRSQDGTRVPMFLSYKKGMPQDGSRPTYLYGYGGFDIPLTPAFSPSILVWMEMGGLFAQANLRGGGEYGKPWHEAGMKLKKQNVFDDFIAAATWLIEKGYTRTPRLAIGGGSNGGLLVGACLTQRPDLFGACLPAVGVLDMLRFHKFTIGWAWTSDYGSPDDAEAFQALRAYSPYHNAKPGVAYPPTLITTADHDDRVFPAHSFKFAAALQAAQAGEAPILIRIETRAGHGLGKPTSKLIEEAADRWAFLTHVMDLEV